MFVWVDETGFQCRHSVRAYGYRGILYRLTIKQNASMPLQQEGVKGVYLSEENVNCDTFEAFVRTTPSSMVLDETVILLI